MRSCRGEEPEAGSESAPEALCQLCGEDGSPCPEGLSCFTHQESDEDFCSVTCESNDECPSEYECAEVIPEGASGEEAGEEAGEAAGEEAGEETDDPTLVRVCVPSAGRIRLGEQLIEFGFVVCSHGYWVQIIRSLLQPRS